MSRDDELINGLRAKDIFGNLGIGFNFELGVLTDLGGLPLSRSEAKALRQLIKEHLKKSPADLSDSAKRIIRQRYPHMEEQFNFDSERYE